MSFTVKLLLGPALFALCWAFAPIPEPAVLVAAITLWMAAWWITEVLPLAVTSLLPVVLFPLTGALSPQATASSYGDPILFLFIGGFIIAKAVERWHLHRRLALWVLLHAGHSTPRLVLGFMAATAFLSMWISNTATTMMMVPIALALTGQIQVEEGQRIRLSQLVMLAIAYSASIGGMATLIGTPPNLILAGVMKQLTGYEIGFGQWMLFGLPLSLLLLAGAWQYLVRGVFRDVRLPLDMGRSTLEASWRELGRLTAEEKRVGLVFLCTALAWVSRPLLLDRLLPGISDTAIALIGAMALFIIPAAAEKRRLITWAEATTLPWGIILLFGGGLALAQGFEASGLSVWIAGQLEALTVLPGWLVLLLVVLVINFLTEVTSNTATTAMMLPILAVVAVMADIPAPLLMSAAAVAASCAFMLPIATAPNAIVFGSGTLSIKLMARTGFAMNIFSVLMIFLLAYLLLPRVLGLS